MAQFKPIAQSRTRIGKHGPTSLLIVTLLASLLLLSMNATQLQKHTQDAIQTPRARYHGLDKALTLPREDIRLNGMPLGRRSDDGTMMILDSERTLWTAGWNARHTRYYKGPVPTMSWTAKAEEIFEREYRRLHFPSSCATVKGYVIVPGWLL